MELVYKRKITIPPAVYHYLRDVIFEKDLQRRDKGEREFLQEIQEHGSILPSQKNWFRDVCEKEIEVGCTNHPFLPYSDYSKIVIRSLVKERPPTPEQDLTSAFLQFKLQTSAQQIEDLLEEIFRLSMQFDYAENHYLLTGEKEYNFAMARLKDCAGVESEFRPFIESLTDEYQRILDVETCPILKTFFPDMTGKYFVQAYLESSNTFHIPNRLLAHFALQGFRGHSLKPLMRLFFAKGEPVFFRVQFQSLDNSLKTSVLLHLTPESFYFMTQGCVL